MSSVYCPHCGAANLTDAAFCASCGKAVPPVAGGGPRIITSADTAATGAGRTLQSEELQKQTKKAAGALLAVAILQAVVGTIILAMAGRNVPPAGYVIIYGVAAVFLGLYFWARKSPFPAAIVGLAVFVTLHLLEAIADPTSIRNGVIIKVIIIVVLVQAISAGAKHRQLLREASLS